MWNQEQVYVVSVNLSKHAFDRNYETPEGTLGVALTFRTACDIMKSHAKAAGIEIQTYDLIAAFKLEHYIIARAKGDSLPVQYRIQLMKVQS